MDWDEAIHRLAESGFTAIIPNMLSRAGRLFMTARFCQCAATVAKRGDQISKCVAACRKYGIKIHVWKLDWNIGAGRAHCVRGKTMRAAGRLQVSSKGKERVVALPLQSRKSKIGN